VLLPRRSSGVEDDLDSDARVLSIIQSPSGERRRPFKDSVREMTETSWPAWPILGPRTARWCLDFIAEQDTRPRARHTKWRHEAGVGGQDIGCQDHELAMRMIELAVVYDQLNITELASFELLLRRAQLAEMRYRDKILGKHGGDEFAEDEFLYMGTGLTRGLVMVSPDLSDHITEQLHKEAAAMKERRKLKEERQASRAPGGGGAGGSSSAAAQGLQQKVNAQAAEIRRLMDKVGETAPAGDGGAGGGRGRGGGRGAT
jgi:hypothetical protein